MLEAKGGVDVRYRVHLCRARGSGLIVVNMANVMAVAIVIVIRIVIVIVIVIVKVCDRVFAKTMKSPCKFNTFNAYP